MGHKAAFTHYVPDRRDQGRPPLIGVLLCPAGAWVLECIRAAREAYWCTFLVEDADAHALRSTINSHEVKSAHHCPSPLLYFASGSGSSDCTVSSEGSNNTLLVPSLRVREYLGLDTLTISYHVERFEKILQGNSCCQYGLSIDHTTTDEIESCLKREENRHRTNYRNLIIINTEWRKRDVSFVRCNSKYQ